MSLFKDVNVVTYHVKDWEAAKKFYGELLGWPVCYELSLIHISEPTRPY
jgi:predicted enzyme related to lactoylglutathione lyase